MQENATIQNPLWPSIWKKRILEKLALGISEAVLEKMRKAIMSDEVGPGTGIKNILAIAKWSSDEICNSPCARELFGESDVNNFQRYHKRFKGDPKEESQDWPIGTRVRVAYLIDRTTNTHLDFRGIFLFFWFL